MPIILPRVYKSNNNSEQTVGQDSNALLTTHKHYAIHNIKS